VYGDWHPGDNNVWYYTLGDDNGNWGYVPAYQIWTHTDPAPGLPQCW
jgi:hypothetical protein